MRPDLRRDGARRQTWHEPSRPGLRRPGGGAVLTGPGRPAAADVGQQPPNLGLYVHWPYCARICPYCDFNVVRDRGREAQKAELVAAMLADVAAHARRTGPRRLVSIFFGGGTPSLMDPDAVAAIIAAARAAWTPAGDLEINLEANPADADAGRLGRLAAAGVDRLSLGVQSLDDANLVALGRNHDALQARRAIAAASEIFPRLSLDMIWGLPGQGAGAWRADLSAALAFAPEHLSVYELTFEPGTAFHRARARGQMTPPDEIVRAELYDLTNRLLAAHGYQAYEVSNHARGVAARARHNMVYWRGEEYVGVGPGAHGRLNLAGVRWETQAPRGVADYVAAVGDLGLGARLERLDGRQAALERLLMGLRTVEGVALAELEPLGIVEERYVGVEGFVRRRDGRLTATEAGRRVLDGVIAHLAG